MVIENMGLVSVLKEEGRQEGIQQGIQQGIVEGIELGIGLKFGARGMEVMPVVRKINNPDRLKIHTAGLHTAGRP